MSELSDDALCLWMTYFSWPKNTLRFGGEGKKVKITDRGRAALDQLINAGAVRNVEPDCQTIGREHYGQTEIDLRDQVKERSNGDFFKWVDEVDFRAFDLNGGKQTLSMVFP